MRGNFPRDFCEISIAIIDIQICLQHKNNTIFGTSWKFWMRQGGNNLSLQTQWWVHKKYLSMSLIERVEIMGRKITVMVGILKGKGTFFIHIRGANFYRTPMFYEKLVNEEPVFKLFS